MNDNADKIDDMTLGEWLRRLNLDYTASQFSALKINELKHLKDFGDEKQLDENKFVFKIPLHKKRFISMVNGRKEDQQTMLDFKLISVNTGR